MKNNSKLFLCKVDGQKSNQEVDKNVRGNIVEEGLDDSKR